MIHEKLEEAKRLYETANADQRYVLESLFPELKEGEDERIRKEIISYLKRRIEMDSSIPAAIGYWIAWLEKQGEQKPVDKVEPKFKVGDWIVYNRNDNSKEIIQIYDIRDGRYYFTDNVHFSWSVKECDEKSHLWTIQDAKDGDVLADDRAILLFRSIGNRNWKDVISCYAILETNLNNRFSISDDEEYWGKVEGCELNPASKEQRDLLFQKMKEAGYEWDSKKELKKIL